MTLEPIGSLRSHLVSGVPVRGDWRSWTMLKPTGRHGRASAALASRRASPSRRALVGRWSMTRRAEGPASLAELAGKHPQPRLGSAFMFVPRCGEAAAFPGAIPRSSLLYSRRLGDRRDPASKSMLDLITAGFRRPSPRLIEAGNLRCASMRAADDGGDWRAACWSTISTRPQAPKARWGIRPAMGGARGACGCYRSEPLHRSPI